LHYDNSKRAAVMRHYANALLFMAVDYIAVVLAQIAAYNICIFSGRLLANSFVFSPDYQYIYIPMIFILCIGTNDGYMFNRPAMDFSRDVFKGVVFGIIMCGILLFAMHETFFVSRAYAGLLSVIVILLVAVFRYVVAKRLKKLPILKERILIIGAGKTAEKNKEIL